MSYNTLDYILKTIKHKDYLALPSHSNQWIMKQLINGNYKSFFESLKKYKQNPSKFLGKPKLPKYKKKNSKTIVDICVKENISKIIIGKNKQWKQNINIGSINNQNFVSIPLERLINLIEYKSKAQGIEVILQEESYTSKASFLDNDYIPILNEIENPTFSGKRILRGLYKSKKGILINSDINGSLNILKKYIIKKEILLELKFLWDRGCVFFDNSKELPQKTKVKYPIVLNF